MSLYKIPEWATGPIVVTQPSSEHFVIQDIPGFPDKIRGEGCLFRTRFPSGSVYEIYSSSGPQDCTEDGQLFVWGLYPAQDKIPRQLVYPQTFWRVIEAYNAFFDPGRMDGRSINGKTSAYNHWIPQINQPYFYKDQGIEQQDVWQYKDQDIQRWMSGPVKTLDEV